MTQTLARRRSQRYYTRPVTNPDTGPTLATRHSDSVVEAFGVNAHLDYGSTSPVYWGEPGTGETGLQTLQRKLTTLGCRHVRETLIIGSSKQRNGLKTLWNNAGIKTMFAATYKRLQSMNPPLPTDVAAEIKAYHRAYTSLVESINEPDVKYNSTAPPADWAPWCTQYHKDIYAAISALGIPVGNPPMVWTQRYGAFGDLTAYTDIHCLHVYPGGFRPVNGLVNNITASQAQVKSNVAANGIPKYLTETGYENAMGYNGGNPPIPEAQAGIYGPRVILDALYVGFSRVYAYDIADDLYDGSAALTAKESHFGLCAWDKTDSTRPSWREKPIFTSISNLLAIMADPGSAYTPTKVGAVTPTLTGSDGSLRYLCFGNRSGKHFVALWRDVDIWKPIYPATTNGGTAITVTPQTVTLTLNTAASVQHYEPHQSRNVLSTTTGTVHTHSLAGQVAILAY